MRRISSSMTTFWKYVFVPLWIAGFGFGTIKLFLDRNMINNNEFENVEYVFLAALIAGSAVFFLWLGRLTSVQLTPTSIIARRFGSTHEISLREIADVEGSRFFTPETVTIFFRNRTELGDSIRFVPRFRLMRFFTEHPIANELRELSVQANSGNTR